MAYTWQSIEAKSIPNLLLNAYKSDYGTVLKYVYTSNIFFNIYYHHKVIVLRIKTNNSVS